MKCVRSNCLHYKQIFMVNQITLSHEKWPPLYNVLLHFKKNNWPGLYWLILIHALCNWAVQCFYYSLKWQENTGSLYQIQSSPNNLQPIPFCTGTIKRSKGNLCGYIFVFILGLYFQFGTCWIIKDLTCWGSQKVNKSAFQETSTSLYSDKEKINKVDMRKTGPLKMLQFPIPKTVFYN